MTIERGFFSPSVYETPGQLSALPGPRTTRRYSLVKSLGKHFYWALGDTTTADNRTVIGHSGGSIGRWLIFEPDGVVWSEADYKQVTSSNTVTEAFRNTVFPLLCYPTSAASYAVNQVFTSYGWDGGDVSLAIRGLPLAAGNGNVALAYSYAWAVSGSALPSASSWTSAVVSLSVTSGEQYIETEYDLGSITPPSYAGAGSELILVLRRMGTATADTYLTNKDHGTAGANFGVSRVIVKQLLADFGSKDETP